MEAETFEPNTTWGTKAGLSESVLSKMQSLRQSIEQNTYMGHALSPWIDIKISDPTRNGSRAARQDGRHSTDFITSADITVLILWYKLDYIRDDICNYDSFL